MKKTFDIGDILDNLSITNYSHCFLYSIERSPHRCLTTSRIYLSTDLCICAVLPLQVFQKMSWLVSDLQKLNVTVVLKCSSFYNKRQPFSFSIILHHLIVSNTKFNIINCSFFVTSTIYCGQRSEYSTHLNHPRCYALSKNILIQQKIWTEFTEQKIWQNTIWHGIRSSSTVSSQFIQFSRDWSFHSLCVRTKMPNILVGTAFSIVPVDWDAKYVAGISSDNYPAIIGSITIIKPERLDNVTKEWKLY